MSSDQSHDDSDDDQWAHIQRANVKPGMFVSGWEDPNDEVHEDTDPHATPQRSILWACAEGRHELVAQLLRTDATLVAARDPDGYTPLHRAAYQNDVPLVRLLLAHGADPNARTQFGWTPVHSACQWTHAECVAVLLQHGADVNATTDGLQTPLHIAASVSNCRPTAVELLARPDIRPEMTNNSHETAATIARRTGLSHPVFEMGHAAFRCDWGRMN